MLEINDPRITDKRYSEITKVEANELLKKAREILYSYLRDRVVGVDALHVFPFKNYLSCMDDPHNRKPWAVYINKTNAPLSDFDFIIKLSEQENDLLAFLGGYKKRLKNLNKENVDKEKTVIKEGE